MSKKEEKAKIVFDSIFECRSCILKDTCTINGGNEDPSTIDCDGAVFLDAFQTGWDEALKNQWISVKEKLPPRYVKVFVLLEYEGSIQIHTYQYCGEHRWHFADAKIIAWMPIPSFDEILEINKDVLKRLKDK